MTAHVGQYAYGHAYYSGVAGAHAVHAVVEVGAVGDGRHHEYRHDDEQHPSGSGLVLAAERHDARVVEVVALDKRNGRLQRLHGLCAVLDDGLLTVVLISEVLVHLHVGRGPEHEAHNETDAHLSHYLVATLQSLLVVAEYLYEVVESAEHAEPHRGDYHEQQIYIAQSAEQQHGHEYRHDDNDTAHRRHAYLLHAEGVYRRVALSLGYLLLLEHLYELLAEPCRDDEREDEREERTKRYVAPHVRATDTILFEEAEKII